VLLRGANAVGHGLRRLGLPLAALSAPGILRTAERRTGIRDAAVAGIWDDARFRRALELMIATYDADARLTVVGRAIVGQMLVHHVANRLRILHDLRRHPQILDQPVRRPLFIVGLHRSGTTLLYNLLAQDRSRRSLLFWETMSPSPPPEPARRDDDPRIAEARSVIRRLHRYAPQVAAMHPFDPVGPEECLGLLYNTFATPLFRGDLPEYRRWLYALDHASLVAAYEEYRQQLQLLQWRFPDTAWLLKCPSHLLGLGALAEVFPDAAIVQTHRDPLEAVPSLCSLVATLDGLCYDPVDARNVGERTATLVGEFVRRAVDARRAIAPGRVFDLHYAALVADPLGAVRRIYAHFDLPFERELEARMETHLRRNPQHKHGVHRYSLADFGLEADPLRERFAAYCERFGVPTG
jgi:hypothetical protein